MAKDLTIIDAINELGGRDSKNTAAIDELGDKIESEISDLTTKINSHGTDIIRLQEKVTYYSLKVNDYSSYENLADLVTWVNENRNKTGIVEIILFRSYSHQSRNTTLSGVFRFNFPQVYVAKQYIPSSISGVNYHNSDSKPGATVDGQTGWGLMISGLTTGDASEISITDGSISPLAPLSVPVAQISQPNSSQALSWLYIKFTTFE